MLSSTDNKTARYFIQLAHPDISKIIDCLFFYWPLRPCIFIFPMYNLMSLNKKCWDPDLWERRTCHRLGPTLLLIPVTWQVGVWSPYQGIRCSPGLLIPFDQGMPSNIVHHIDSAKLLKDVYDFANMHGKKYLTLKIKQNEFSIQL